jgi:hypothetical protein
MELDLAACGRRIEASRAGEEAGDRDLIEHIYPFAMRSVKRDRSM